MGDAVIALTPEAPVWELSVSNQRRSTLAVLMPLALEDILFWPKRLRTRFVPQEFPWTRQNSYESCSLGQRETARGS